MNIYVRNRAEAIQICNMPKGASEFVMISIGTPDQEYTSWPKASGPVKAIMYAEFYDVGVRDPENLPWISGHTALEIAGFIKAHASDNTNFIVHCDGGISRSAAVAKAIATYYNIPLRQINTLRQTHPNDIVFRRMMVALNRK